MTWQDIVLTIGAWSFIIALIPSVKGKDKPALSTSIMTGVVLIAFVIVYASLGLIWATISTSIVCILWLILAYQKFKIDRKQKTEG